MDVGQFQILTILGLFLDRHFSTLCYNSQSRYDFYIYLTVMQAYTLVYQRYCHHSIIFPAFLVTWLTRKIRWTQLPAIKTEYGRFFVFLIKKYQGNLRKYFHLITMAKHVCFDELIANLHGYIDNHLTVLPIFFKTSNIGTQIIMNLPPKHLHR